jgi:predicted nucleic acid-binding protein
LTVYVLDTSAILAMLADEPGAERVSALLQPSAGDVLHEAGDEEVDGCLLPFLALMELEYLARRRLGEAEASRLLQLVQSWPAEVVESESAWRHEAARVKATTPLSVADAWIASLALLHDAVLVHKDPEYDAVDGLLAERLPYR